MKILIKTRFGTIEAEIDETKNPKTARAIIQALPIESKAKLWGKEIYFEIPVRIEKENSQEEVEVGDLAYWVEGSCFCIFFGKTPASKNEKPRAYSPVNVFGRITTENFIEVLERVKHGEKIRVEKA
ncbi:MAG: cyclophilin-like fold protein [Candidatus Aenigmatarchaeota archaeon]